MPWVDENLMNMTLFEVFLSSAVYQSVSMMKSYRIFLAGAACCAFLVNLMAVHSLPAGTEAASCAYIHADVPAPSIGVSLIDEAHSQKVHILLPPSYEGSQARYPVLYFFTGYYSDEEVGYLGEVMSELAKDREFILVSVKCVNSLHGSFGMNSPVTGNWRDFYVKDLIPFIDANYRTIADRGSRAVGGVSMGGHIALRLGLEHPELFNALYALAPGVFDEKGLETAWPKWDRTFLIAYGAAVAPNTEKPFPHADIPTMDGSAEDMAARARWNSGFGEVPQLLDGYLARGLAVDNICIEVGTNDWYEWIPQGCVYLSRQMFERGISHSFILTRNGHDFSPEIFRNGMGPFVQAAFSPASGAAE